MSFVVSQRTREVGIRMALGARPGEVQVMILRQGLTVAAIGLAIGVGGAMAVTGLAESLLYNISPRDPATFAGVAVIMTVAAALACSAPARRAANVAPTEALRWE